MRNRNEEAYMLYSTEDGVVSWFPTLTSAFRGAWEYMRPDDDGVASDYVEGGLRVLKVVSESYVAGIRKQSDLFTGEETEEEREAILDEEWPVSTSFDEIMDIEMTPVNIDEIVLQAMVEALKWYAYCGFHSCEVDKDAASSALTQDGGWRAQKALRKVRGEE